MMKNLLPRLLPSLAPLAFGLAMWAPGMGHAAASEASVKAHLDAATLAAGSDLDGLLRLCQPAPVARPSVTDGGLAKLIATPGPEATKAFDNLFYLGSGWVSAWALKTSDGLVLIDALNTVEETDRLIIGGLRKLGLDPTQIKAVVVTHGHGDHYGGAQRIREVAAVSKPRIVMSELDWTMTQTQLEFASPLWPAPPKRDTARDVAVRDGDSFQQGSTTLTLALTPGHTWGTVSPVFDVQWAGRSHKAIIWGGTGFNFGRDLPRMDAYIASTERMRELVQRERVEVLISNHPGLDNSVSRLAALRADPDAKNPNPYVVGTAHVLRALTVAGECARANRERFEMMP